MTARAYLIHLAVGLCLLAGLSGCAAVDRAATAAWPRPRIEYYHAANAAQAAREVALWRASVPAAVVSQARTTGSMRPHIHGGDGEWLLLRPVAPDRRWVAADVGLVVSFARDARTKRCLHMVAAVSGDGEWLYMSGTNNRRSDGWAHRSAVSAELVRVVRWPVEGIRR